MSIIIHCCTLTLQEIKERDSELLKHNVRITALSMDLHDGLITIVATVIILLMPKLHVLTTTIGINRVGVGED